MADVGVVMPVYRQRASYLRDAIQSLRAQNYRDFKLIIVLDGAPQPVQEIVQQSCAEDTRVCSLTLPRQSGVATALNCGFRTLLKDHHLRYLTWVSSDNLYFPDYLYVLRDALRQAPESVGLVYSSFACIDEHGQPARQFGNLPSFQRWQQQPKENLLEVDFIGASFMYKRQFAEKVGHYRLDPVQDYDYWLRLAEHGDLCYVPQQLMAYRIDSPLSVSQTLHTKPMEQRRARYHEQLAKLQARHRRAIPCETTIIVPIHAANRYVEQQLDTLFNQPYANVAIWLVDTSGCSVAADIVRTVPDPRVSLCTSTDKDPDTAVLAACRQVQTPFTLIMDPAHPSKYDLKRLVHVLHNAPASIPGVYHVGVAVRYDHQLLQKGAPPRTLCLYRTSLLQRWL